MSQIITKGIADNAVNGAKFRLPNNTAARARNAAGNADVSLFKLNTSDKLEFAVTLNFGGFNAENVSNLQDASAVNAIDIPVRELLDSSGAQSLNWDSAGLTIYKKIIPNATDTLDIGSVTLRINNVFAQQIINPGALNLRADGGDVVLNVEDASAVSLLSTAASAAIPIRFYDADGSNYVGLKAPATVSADVTFVLPAADGTNGQVLATDGSGNLSFVSTGGSVPTWQKQTYTLNSTDITNQYIDLSSAGVNGSYRMTVKGLGPLIQGTSYDYDVADTGGAGGVARLTFYNDLATGGASALVAGDIVEVQYQTP